MLCKNSKGLVSPSSLTNRLHKKMRISGLNTEILVNFKFFTKGIKLYFNDSIFNADHESYKRNEKFS